MFYFKGKHLFDSINHLFLWNYFCALFSNIYPKINFMVKNWSDPCIFYSEQIFWEKKQQKTTIKYFFIYPTNFLTIDISQYYCKNSRHFELVENLPPIYLPYGLLALFIVSFTMLKKNENISIWNF